MKIEIAPSILSADFGRLNEEIRAVEKYVERLHIDVMDGHFVPNITIGPVVVSKIRSKLPKDCHLMIEHPEKYLEAFQKAGASSITIHLEAETKVIPTLKKIKKLGMVAGLSIKPKTPVNKLTPGIMKHVGLLLIMTVEPGFGGQQILPSTIAKIAQARKRFPKLDIMVDGGINNLTAKACIEAGANILVAGNYIFSAGNYRRAVESIKK